MIRSCRKVLKKLRKLSSSTENILCFLGDTCCICLYTDYSKVYDYTKYKGEINSIIKQLVADGYLTYSFNEYHFTLTQRGLHPCQFRWDALKRFLLNSILVPIAVSLLTTLLTLLVQALLISQSAH